ncbi:methyltransferase domain-containing protein [bacterium]|nr:MAG: methyltransferase domain-containing protein [bacterium]
MKYENGEAYDRSMDDPYTKLWFEMMEHYLDVYLPETGDVLDAGGGTGEFTIRAAKLRPRITFINFDISQNMLNTAFKKITKLGMESRIRNKQGDIMELPFDDESFNYVMCFGDALSFCSDVGKAFSELARVTGKNGVLHISVNSFWGNFVNMIGRGPDIGFSFEDIKKYYDSRIIHQNGVSTGCMSFTFHKLLEMGKQNGFACLKAFATPVFPVYKDWLAENDKYEYMLDLQYKNCENMKFIDFGNHINVIYKKQCEYEEK